MNISVSYGHARSAYVRVVALAAASMVTVMLVAQLYTYEDLATTLMTILPPMSEATVMLVSAVIVMVELLALPYLLSLYLSKLMRIVSAFAAVIVILFWFFVALTTANAPNAGIFGGTIQVSGGIITLVWTSVLAACITYVLYRDRRSAA